MRPLPRRGVHRPPGTLRALLRGAVDPSALERFEATAADVLSVEHAVAVGSGRLAQRLLLEGLGLPAGATVLLPALTFHAVPAVVRDLGFRVRFVDVDPRTLLVDMERLAEAFAEGAAAVVVTHLFGLVQPLGPVRELAEEAGAVVLEDFAQAFGATEGAAPVGGRARAGYTSLETVKILPTFGGGLAVTNDAGLAAHLRSARARLAAPAPGRLAKKVLLGHVEAALSRPEGFALAWPIFGRGDDADLIARYKAGKKKAGSHAAALHPAQAAVGLAGLAALPAHLARRRALAERLRGQLGGCDLPTVAPDTDPAWYQVVARCSDPDGLAAAARAEGVDIGRGVATDLSEGACREAAEAARSVVQLPCHPGLTDADVDRVAAVARPWLSPAR